MKKSIDHTNHQEKEATQDSESVFSEVSCSSQDSEPTTSLPKVEVEIIQNSDNSTNLDNHSVENSANDQPSRDKDFDEAHKENHDMSIFEQAIGNMQEDINFNESTGSESDSKSQRAQPLTDSQIAFLHSLGISVMKISCCYSLGRCRGLLEHSLEMTQFMMILNLCLNLNYPPVCEKGKLVKLTHDQLVQTFSPLLLS